MLSHMSNVPSFLSKCWQCLKINVTCGHSGQHWPLGDPSLAAVTCPGQAVGFCEVLQCVEEGCCGGGMSPVLLPIPGCPHGSSPASATLPRGHRADGTLHIHHFSGTEVVQKHQDSASSLVGKNKANSSPRVPSLLFHFGFFFFKQEQRLCYLQVKLIIQTD